MVVRIKIGRSVRGALTYNERKVAKGQAELIMASGFSCDVNHLGFTQKLRRFQVLNERNTWVKKNTLHLSLNFPPDEILSIDKMQMIALDYMDRIGFGKQPFLVYKHKDTLHPHIHIVTTTVQENAKGIKLHFIARDRSEPARKAIEAKFNLIQAETRKRGPRPIVSAFKLLPAKYGKEETKHIISNIVGEIVDTYRFTSFEEFNFLLRQMNIVADRGTVNSRMFQTGGLVYSIIDDDGYRIGQSIKSSEIYQKPTLKALEAKFSKNVPKKEFRKHHTEKSVRFSIANCSSSRTFLDSLRKRSIRIHIDKNSIGAARSIYFLDLRNKAAFSNEELGITSAELARFLPSGESANISPTKSSLTTHQKKPALKDSHIFPSTTFSTNGVINILLRPAFQGQGGSGQVPKKRKKKRKGPSL